MITVRWYDGKDHKPARDGMQDLPDDYKLPHAGSVLIGEKGTMVIPHWSEPKLFPRDKFNDYKVEPADDLNHYTGWAHACLDDGTTYSNFGYAGPLTEAVLLGGIAIRFPHEQLQWDAASGQFTHHADANSRLTKEYRKGWELPAV
jgi:hypothetical protein